MTTKEAIEQRKKRAVEFLLSKRLEYKRPDQLTVRECADLMNRKDTSSMYDYMNELVKQGLWETGYAMDAITHKRIKVWWVKDG